MEHFIYCRKCKTLISSKITEQGPDMTRVFMYAKDPYCKTCYKEEAKISKRENL